MRLWWRKPKKSRDELYLEQLREEVERCRGFKTAEDWLIYFDELEAKGHVLGLVGSMELHRFMLRRMMIEDL